jgi:hypothetical protein
MSRCQAEMYQCAEGHLFCAECATKNAETKLGEQRVVSVRRYSLFRRFRTVS